MPNWCNNTLTLTHSDPAMIDKAITAYNAAELFDTFIPVPEALKITAGFLGDGAEQKALEAKEQDNLNKYGHKNWYDWCIANWGTKWDISPWENVTRVNENTVTFGFDTAWGPAIQAYEAMEALGFSIDAMYYEPGMAFAGMYQDGYDEYFELGGYDAKGLAEMLPERLDETFSISQSVAEWEEENQEIDLDGGLSSINE